MQFNLIINVFFLFIYRMIPVHNYSMSPDSLLVDGIEPHKIRHHHGHKSQPKILTSTNEDKCYCKPFK